MIFPFPLGSSRIRPADAAEHDEDVIDPDTKSEKYQHHDDAGGDEAAEYGADQGDPVYEKQQSVDRQLAEQFKQQEHNENGGDDDQRHQPADDHPQKYLDQNEDRQPHSSLALETILFPYFVIVYVVVLAKRTSDAFR